MKTNAQILIDAAIESPIGKVSLTDEHADEVYDYLKPFLMKGMGCMFIMDGYQFWLDCEADGEQFLYARQLPILG